MIIMKIKINKFQPRYIEKDSLYICAGGFEDRAKGLLEKLCSKSNNLFKYSCLCEYNVHHTENISNINFLLSSLSKLTQNNPNRIPIELDNIYNARNCINKYLENISTDKIDHVYIDISGMSNFLTLIMLSECYDIFFNSKIHIIYAEAEEYYPTEKESKRLIDVMKNPIKLNPRELEKFTSTGVKEFFPLPEFRGNFDEKPIALILFIGYEPIRIAGFLNQYRPKLTIALYGKSPHPKFAFRTDYSKKIHGDVLADYSCYNDEVSTFDIDEIFGKLQNIYRRFYQTYNISIFPQNSKLQTVASFLFVKDYPDVQLVYCLPGKFNPKHYSKGVGNIFFCTIK